MNFPRRTIVISLACGLLAACSGNSVKQTLGLDRGAPDEFRVVSRPPLSVPPEFSLRPPSNTDLPPGHVAASDKAEATVLGKPADTAVIPVASASVKTPATSNDKAANQFLQNAGATQANPKIRDQLTEDRIAAQTPPEEEKSWWNFWSSDEPKKDTLVDAQKEQDRIKTDEQANQPVTTGDTPVVKDKDTGLLGRIFGY